MTRQTAKRRQTTNTFLITSRLLFFSRRKQVSPRVQTAHVPPKMMDIRKNKYEKKKCCFQKLERCLDKGSLDIVNLFSLLSLTKLRTYQWWSQEFYRVWAKILS